MKLHSQFSHWLLGLLLLVQTLSACRPSTQQNAETTSSTKTQTSGSKEQIVLAIGGEAEEGYDPTLGWGRYGSSLFQSTLLRRDENLKVVNDLATSYNVSKDKKVWTVKIREDAKFADGKPVTAQDVAYTFNKAAQSANTQT